MTELESTPSTPPAESSAAAGNSVPDPVVSEPVVSGSPTMLQELVSRSQKTMAHAWMIRTFVKHSDEVEDYPALNEMARTIFDTFRALETQAEDPVGYFKVVRKKIGKLKSAAAQFEMDAWHASTHTNFQQAVISAKYVAEQLAELLLQAEVHLPRPAVPPRVTLPVKTVTQSEIGEVSPE
jgi:hypothetical protein